MLKADIDKEIKNLANQEGQQFPPDQEFNPQILKQGQAFTIEDPAISRSNGGAGDGINDGTQGILGDPYDDSIRVNQPFQKPLKKIDAEGIIVDELLSSVPKAQGYYLKLEKEVSPNEYQLKTRIDNYETWSDLEWELTKLVREMTKRNPSRWGTGKYRLIIWKEGGIRGQKRPPMYFHIDADEQPQIQGQVQAQSFESQLDGLSRFTETLHKISPPSQQLAPSDILKIASESMAAGQKIAVDKEASGNNAMAAMMTAMVQMMQQSNQQMMTLFASMNQKKEMDPLTLMLIKEMMDNKGDKNKNPLSLIKELKDAGLIPERKEQGLAGEIQNLIQMKELAEMFGGGSGDEGNGGVLDTLIKSLAPKLPELVGNVTSTINKVVEFNKAKLAAMEGRLPAKPNPPKEIAPTQEGEIQSEEEKKEMLIKMFTKKLHSYVVSKQYDKFPEITKSIRLFTGGAPILEDAIKQGTMGTPDMMKFIKEYSKDLYTTEEEDKLLEEYVSEYIKHVKEQGELFHVKCEKCGAEYNYDDQNDFETDVKDGAKCEDCEGNLVAA